MSFINELKRRNVFRVGVAYLIGAWLLLQIADVVLGNISAPEWVFKVIMLVVGIGLPLALFFAWAFELTPGGVKREHEVDRSQSMRQKTGLKLDRGIIVILVVALGYFVWESRFESDEVTPPVAHSAQIDQPATQTSVDQEQSVAVLPFVNMSSDPEQEYFSDGITEEIINALVKIPGLSVPARTSVFGFKGQQGDVKNIGEQLGVAHILEGSIRSQGNQVRITAQLIKVSDGFHLWSQTYDRKLDNIFIVQEEIASAIAEVLTGELGLGETSVPNKTRNMEAYDLYLQGRSLLRKRDEQATEILEQATLADPDFAPAWAALAIAYQVTRQQDKAMQTAETALQLDPDNVDALDALASVLRTKMRWGEAEYYYDRALAIDPHSAELLEDYAEFLAYVGRTDEALDVTSRGIEIDPKLIPLLVAHMEALLSNGKPEEALQVFTDVTSEAIDDLWWWALSLEIHLSQNDFTPDAAFIESLAIPAEMLPTVEALIADPSDKQATEAIKTWFSEEVITESLKYYIARTTTRVLLAYANESDYVLDISMAIMGETSFGLEEWAWTPVFKSIRQNPRYEEYLEKAGLIQYWDDTDWPEWCWRNDDGKVECK
jgi:TolB-like protein